MEGEEGRRKEGDDKKLFYSSLYFSFHFFGKQCSDGECSYGCDIHRQIAPCFFFLMVGQPDAAKADWSEEENSFFLIVANLDPNCIDHNFAQNCLKFYYL